MKSLWKMPIYGVVLMLHLLSYICWGYVDVDLTPGKEYHSSSLEHVHSLIRKYMRYSTAASSFVDIDKGWTSCGMACNSPDVQNVILNMTWHNEVPLSDGLVAVHHEDKEIVVSWAGTHRYRAVLMDMAVFPSPYIPGSGIQVHSGFLDSVRGMIDQVRLRVEALMNDYPEYIVIFTGHSKGGSEAVLSALDLARSIDGLIPRMKVWTFGQPKVGDENFATYYNSILGSVTYRVTNVADPVILAPPSFMFGYCHHALEVWLKNEQGNIYVGQNTSGCNEDPDASSSIPFSERNIKYHKSYLGLPPKDHADAMFSW